MRTCKALVASFCLAFLPTYISTTAIGVVFFLAFCSLIIRLPTIVHFKRTEHIQYLRAHRVTPVPFRGSSANGYYDGSHQCETKTNSPLSSDILVAAELLRNTLTPERCLQLEYGSGSDHCTKLAITGSVSVAICGEMGRGVYCNQAAWAAEVIAKDCQWNGVSEGKVYFKQISDVVVIVRSSNDPVRL